MPFGRKKSLMDRAHDYVEQLSETVTDTVVPQLESAWEQAVEKAGPALTDARDKAQPLLEEGRTRAAEAATAGAALAAVKTAEAREKAAPLLAEARATAADKAAVAAALAAERAAEARELAATKVNELRGVEPEPQGSKLKKLLLVTGLLAIGGFVFTKLKAKQDAEANWQSTYVPPAPPKPRHDRVGHPAAHARLPGDDVGRTRWRPAHRPAARRGHGRRRRHRRPAGHRRPRRRRPGRGDQRLGRGGALADRPRRARRRDRHRRRAPQELAAPQHRTGRCPTHISQLANVGGAPPESRPRRVDPPERWPTHIAEGRKVAQAPLGGARWSVRASRRGWSRSSRRSAPTSGRATRCARRGRPGSPRGPPATSAW